jgi:tetratricopeptide (TPR) repeat protein
VVGRALIHETESPARQEVLLPFSNAFTLRGTVRPAPYSIGLDVQLLDASGAQVWARTYRRDPAQVLALQAEIGREVAARFNLELPTGSRWARGMNRLVLPAAYDIYLQGRDASERRDRARAIAAYQQALNLDGRLVEARAQLSLALYLEEFYSGITGDAAGRESAMREAQAAIAVDPDLAAAQMASALASPNMIGAASALSRALAIDASNGEAWHYAGDLVSETDPARALAYYRASLAFEPTIDANYLDEAAALSELGRYQEAESAVVRGEVARPGRPWWRQMRARIALEQQNPRGALDLLSTDPATESSPGVWLMGRIVPLITTGRAADARAEVLRLEQRYPSSCEARAIRAGIELSLGDGAQAQSTADALYAEASRPNALPSLKACAAMAAAAVKSSADAAGWLAKIAEDDRALRAWTRQSIFGIGMSYRRGWYPWYNVNNSGPVKEADSQLRAALGRVQREVVRRLPTPPAHEHGGE